ncbi:MAG TPA: DUF202 domain-containing protein [Candidatus Hydrogenedentes bacterium]|nr:DUF202 domain-containing protein [Candidatus Hydrogenedentota bacterium]
MTENSDTWIRDNLALIRTSLANERTMLAYSRTALALVAAGAFFVKFTNSRSLELCGWVLMPLGMVVFVFGLWRFQRTRKILLDHTPK